MEVTLEQVADKLAEMSNQLAGLEKASAELKEQARTYKDELKEQARVYREDLKDDVKKAAEGYDGTLQAINRQLRDLNEKVDTKFGDHDLILSNHNERITRLENR